MMLGKIEGRRKRRMKWLHGITGSMDMRLSKLRNVVKDREAWSATVQRVAKSQTRLNTKPSSLKDTDLDIKVQENSHLP